MEIETLLIGLAQERPWFFSEADFQHALAMHIQLKHPNAQVRLEVPLNQGDGKKGRLDIKVVLDGQLIAIELKYKKAAINVVDSGYEYRLAADTAADVSRYDFIKDIIRLEGIVKTDSKAIGYAIFLSNQPLFWTEGQGTADDHFRIHEGRCLVAGEPLCWPDRSANLKLRGYKASLVLRNSYMLQWKDYATLTDKSRYDRFRYLITTIQ